MNLDAALERLPGYRHLVDQSEMSKDQALFESRRAVQQGRMCASKAGGAPPWTDWASDAEAYLAMAEYFAARAGGFLA